MHHEKMEEKTKRKDLMGKNDKKNHHIFSSWFLTSILHIFAEAILTIKKGERREPKKFLGSLALENLKSTQNGEIIL